MTTPDSTKHPQSTQSSAAGFTLVELLVTLAIAIILVSLAIPSFKTILQNSLRDTHINLFLGTLHFARSEAIRQEQRTSICKSTTGTECSNIVDWETGWIVFLDASNPGTLDPTDTLLRRYEGVVNGGYTLRGDAGMANSISFTSDGFSRTNADILQTGKLIFCDDRGFGNNARIIVLNAIGKTSIENVVGSTITSCQPG